MPPRKSDARRSDVSTARTVPVDNTSAMAVDPAPPAAESSEPAAASSPMPPPAPPAASGPAPSEAGSERKEKEKEKEKDKDREKDAVTIEDLVLPKSIITRLAKGVLPPNTQIQANAILALTKSATVFINHLANASNEFTQLSNKKTIMPQDVFQALDEIDMGFMREQLEAEFSKFAETQSNKRSTYRRKVAAAKKGTSGDASGIAESSMVSFASTNGPEGPGGDETEVDDSTADRSRLESGREAKKPKPSGNGFHPDEVSDAETVPDENVEEDDDDSAEEEEDDEQEEGDETQGENEDDEMEERGGRDDGDEALDDGDSD
ncbi:histone-fold-containing protein [Thozetella sp. PMI_491]|nr:histone-fold-containing protein [Thozetella sp. PMI_491]